jgi:hypothetical protein
VKEAVPPAADVYVHSPVLPSIEKPPTLRVVLFEHGAVLPAVACGAGWMQHDGSRDARTLTATVVSYVQPKLSVAWKVYGISDALCWSGFWTTAVAVPEPGALVMFSPFQRYVVLEKVFSKCQRLSR